MQQSDSLFSHSLLAYPVAVDLHLTSSRIYGQSKTYNSCGIHCFFSCAVDRSLRIQAFLLAPRRWGLEKRPWWRGAGRNDCIRRLWSTSHRRPGVHFSPRDHGRDLALGHGTVPEFQCGWWKNGCVHISAHKVAHSGTVPGYQVWTARISVIGFTTS